MASYFDYEAMEYTPEISAALDIFADEATTANENGKILSIYSESTRIKNELTDLFENVLDINTNLTSWARNLCKYGDNFVYNKIVPKKGIVGCVQLPNIEITRTEPGFVPVRIPFIVIYRQAMAPIQGLASIVGGLRWIA